MVWGYNCRIRKLQAIFRGFTNLTTGFALFRDLIKKCDSYTGEHCDNVMDISLKICDKLGGWSKKDREMLRIMAEFHDIGKIGVGRSIISKPGKLTDAEYEEMKKHTIYGANFLKKFSRVYGIHYGALYHHERWDGKGYPYGTMGTSIPIEARIIGLADAYDAMSNDRCYRKKLSRYDIIKELKKARGTQFDPQLVDILLEIMDEEKKAGKYTVEVKKPVGSNDNGNNSGNDEKAA